MPEVETEAQLSRSEIGAYLRDFADQLDGGGAVALELGGKQITLDPAEPVTFKLEGEVDRSTDRPKESIEFELVWWRESPPGTAGPSEPAT